eukprot:CAMPEP_0117660066 /NCGR_PEP_ID=MMETSP0804-20121206/6769_1 /TAXON_ID=1074897 /ORGANISM="Tetraselmis astigmatica, Strain CCMP880" /LENGTH=75 /DNA_ID=CAMNT_0005466769 /DNA_START=182 /DNA_END=406 /DNA_ORIENTATION=-
MYPPISAAAGSESMANGQQYSIQTCICVRRDMRPYRSMKPRIAPTCCGLAGLAGNRQFSTARLSNAAQAELVPVW